MLVYCSAGRLFRSSFSGMGPETLRAHVPEPPGHDPEETPDIPPPGPPDEDIDLPPRETPAPVRDPEKPPQPG